MKNEKIAKLNALIDRIEGDNFDEKLKKARELLEEEDNKPLFDVQKCRVCGCTWDNACEGGCYWVEYDLCSKCAEKKEK